MPAAINCSWLIVAAATTIWLNVSASHLSTGQSLLYHSNRGANWSGTDCDAIHMNLTQLLSADCTKLDATAMYSLQFQKKKGGIGS